MSWFYFALAAPVFYAVVNIIDDNLVQYAFDSPLVGAGLAGMLAVLPVVGALFITISNISMLDIFYSFLAGLSLTVFYLFYYMAFKYSQPSVVIAGLNLVPATLIFLAYLFLHERLTAIQLIGFFVVLVPTIVLSLSNQKSKKIKLTKATVYILSAVAVLDISSLLLKYAYQHTAFYPVFFYYCVGTGTGGLAFYLLNKFSMKRAMLKPNSSLKKVGAILILAAIINFGAELFINLAISRGPVAVVRVIEGIQPIYVLLIAFVFFPFAPKYFREAKTVDLFGKLALIAITAAGLVLIAKS